MAACARAAAPAMKAAAVTGQRPTATRQRVARRGAAVAARAAAGAAEGAAPPATDEEAGRYVRRGARVQAPRHAPPGLQRERGRRESPARNAPRSTAPRAEGIALTREPRARTPRGPRSAVVEETVSLKDPATGREVPCVVRRRFDGDDGLPYALLLPVDTPIEVLADDPVTDEMTDLNDGELDAILPLVSERLAARRLYVQNTAYCLTVRGAVRYSDEDIVSLDLGEDGDETAAEGVELLGFEQDGVLYTIFTPVEALIFVVSVAEDGSMSLVPDERLGEPAIQWALEAEHLAFDEES